MESILINVLTDAKIKKKYIETLTTPKSLSYFVSTFTDPSYDPYNNYLFLRSLGTVSIHKIYVWHIYKNFDVNPKTLTEIKKKFMNDTKFGEFMEQTYHISEHILYDQKVKLNEKIIQYVFEAFIGTIEFLLDKNYKKGIGYITVNKLCVYLLTKMNIVVEESNLTDSKTKLKELFTELKTEPRYLVTKDEETCIFHVKVYDMYAPTQLLGEGSGKTIIKGEKEAAEKALALLASKGIYKSEKLKKTKYIDKQLIYYAPRDKTFVSFITSFIERASPLIKNISLEKEDIELFGKAFTHPDITNDSSENYDLYETLGDNTLNKCILWYLSDRFPQLNCPEGIDILTKLKISSINTNSFARLADKFGFYQYISCMRSMIGVWKKKEILEDVFESFFSVIEIVIDRKFKPGMGYIVCYKILSSILNEEEYCITYNNLVDPKTQLKELFDSYKSVKIEWRTSKEDRGLDEIYTSTITESVLIPGTDKYGPYKPIGQTSIGYTKKEAEKDVSKKALQYYKNRHISKKIPNEYLKFCM